MKIAILKLSLFLVLMTLCMYAQPARADTSPSLLAPEEVLARMEERIEQQYAALESYRARRRYSAADSLSSTTTPAPSPRFRPSRSLSNGRQGRREEIIRWIKPR